jgi:hypothetical protein
LNAHLILQNLLAPPILFFFLGMSATWLGSDLSIPQPIARFLSLYLLFAIGLHGGAELATSGLGLRPILALATAVLLALAVPVWSFFVLRLKLDVANAAAVAATYGSISAVTFVTAGSFLDDQGIHWGGHMVAAMALMESPAIIVGVFLARSFSKASAQRRGSEPTGAREILREAFLNGAVFLLLGSLFVGVVTGKRGWEAVKPLADLPFKGVLCLFLLDMGLVAAKRLRDLRASGRFLLAFALVAPPVHAAIGIFAAMLLGLDRGDALLLAVLSGSASYIAVPAAMRLSVPEANPSVYVSMALAVTFPFNIAIGIPLYLAVIDALR